MRKEQKGSEMNGKQQSRFSFVNKVQLKGKFVVS